MKPNFEQVEAHIAALSAEVDSQLAVVESNLEAAMRHADAANAAQIEVAAKQVCIRELRNELAQLQGALPGESWDDFQARVKREQEDRYCV
jgi:hypothetical protein